MRLTDGGLETSLIYHQGLDLPHFAAFPLVETSDGKRALEDYWMPYLAVADEHGVPFVVDTPTWRASPDWGARLGYDAAALWAANEAAARFARHLTGHVGEAIVNGVVGPRGDGYVVGEQMSADEAADYHGPQIEALAGAGADQVSAITFTYPDEAIGFVRAASAVGVPCLVSFTVETGGRLPNGDALREAVDRVDRETGGAAGGFMVNCAHPAHFEGSLVDGDWLERIRGVRANASTMSHAELDAAEELDEGDPEELGAGYVALRTHLPSVNVLGGCCGTDERHVAAVAAAWASA